MEQNVEVKINIKADETGAAVTLVSVPTHITGAVTREEGESTQELIARASHEVMKCIDLLLQQAEAEYMESNDEKS